MAVAISGLPTGAILLGTDISVMVSDPDGVGKETQRVSLAALRTALFAGGASYAADDALELESIVAASATITLLGATTGTITTLGATTATLGRITGPADAISLGSDAAAGTDTVATSITFTGPLSRGIGTPAGIDLNVGVAAGSTGSSLQTPTLGLRVREVANAASREIVARAPVIHGGLATGAAVWNENGDTGRFLTRVQIVRFGNSAGLNMGRAGGTEGSPSGLLSGESVAAWNHKGYDSTGAWVTIAQMVSSLRENLTGTARGSRLDFAVFPVGSVTQTNVLRLNAGSTTIGEWQSGQATLRIVSGATLTAFRDSTNASDIFSMNGSGTTILAPLATAFVIGTDPTGSELLRVGGSVRAGAYVNTGGTILRSVANSVHILSGGTSSTNGGSLYLYGGSHATQANDIELRSGSTVKGFWDDSATQWSFSDTFVHTGNALSVAQGTASNQALTVGSGTAAFTTDIRINAMTAQYGRISFRSAGVERWVFYMDNTAELGGNVGRQLTWAAHTDAGAFIDNVLRVSREANGSIVFSPTRPITGGTFNGNTISTTTGTFPSITAFVIGTDPTGSALLRVGGSARFNGNVSLGGSGTTTRILQMSVTTAALAIEGGDGSLGSANVLLYGSTHASKANDIEFRSGANVRGWWDDSAALWEFSNATSLLSRFSTPAAGETSLWLYDADNATLERVTVGAADSGGVGYKALRIPN